MGKIIGIDLGTTNSGIVCYRFQHNAALLSFAAALLIAGQLVAPAAAVPLAADPCGSDYLVQNKDTLQKIADLCGTTVSNILELNPRLPTPT